MDDNFEDLLTQGLNDPNISNTSSLDASLGNFPDSIEQAIPSSSTLKPESVELANSILEDTKFKEELGELSKGEKSLLRGNQPNTFFDIPKQGLVQGGYEVNSSDVRQTLNNGDMVSKFESYTPMLNNEDNLAIQQSGWEQALNGVTKGVSKTALNVLDGTVGTVVGLVNGISEGSLSAVYNNGFSKWIDDVNTKLDYKLPNYYTEEQKNMNFLQSLATTNFWANDLTGGMSFMFGTIGSEAIWAVATGGASLATTLPRLALKAGAKTLLKTGAKESGKHFYKNSLKLLKAYNRTIPASNVAKVLNNTRFMYTSAGYESGVEARHSLNESLESFMTSYQKEFGRAPNGAEYTEFMDEAVRNSNLVFSANLALVGGSNIAQYGAIFGVGTGLNKALTKGIGKVFGLGVTKTIDDTGRMVYSKMATKKFQRSLGNTLYLLKEPIIEGFVEEGGQGVISKTSQAWLEARFNPDAYNSNLKLVDAAKHSIEETYTTKEGFKEVGLGMLIGAIGGRVSRLTSGKGVLGSDYSDSMNQLDSQVNYLNEATTKMTSAQKDLITKLLATNQFNTYLEKSKSSAEKGDFSQAGIEWDTAQYSKLLAEDSAGMLDESLLDFQRVIENTPTDKLQEDYGITKQQATEYKKAIVNDYAKNVNLFRQTNKIAESVGLNNLGFEINKQDYTQELGLNIYLGVKALERAEDLTDSIDEFIGTTGTGSALRLYTNLTKKAKRRAERIVTLERDIQELERQYAENQIAFTSTNPSKTTRVQENKEVANKLNKNEQKQQRLQTQLLKKRTELEELSSKLENRFYKSKFAFGGNTDLFRNKEGNESEFITDSDLKNSVLELEKLDKYRELLKEQDKGAYETLNNLLSEYTKNVKAYRDFNIVFEQMADPRFASKNYKGLARLFKNVGTTFNDKVLSKNPLDIQVQAFEKFKEANKDLTKDELLTLDTLHRLSTAFYLNLEVGDLSESSDPINNEDYKLFNETNEVSEGIKNSIVDKLVSNTQLSKRESEIFNTLKDELTVRVNEMKEKIGDNIPTPQETTQTSSEPRTLQEKLNNTLSNFKKKIKYLRDLDIENMDESSIPTESEYKEYQSLFKDNLENNLSPKKRGRYVELKEKINNWGSVEGTTVSRGVQLSDLIEQLVLIQSQDMSEDNNTLPNITDLNDLLDGIDFKPSEKSGNYDNLQTYDKAMVTQNIDGDFVVSNINLSGFLNELNSSSEITVLRKGKTLKSDAGLWNITDVKENQRYTVKIGEESVVIKIGRGGTLVFSKSSKNVLNKDTRIRIFPSGNLPTYYQPLLKLVNENGTEKFVPVTSNFTFSNSKKMNIEAIREMKQDDLVYLEVDMNDPYNKKLFKEYNEASEEGKEKLFSNLVSQVVIYAKDKKNRLVGVHKAIPSVTTEGDSNLETLDDIRRTAINRVLDENYLEEEVIDLGLSIPVKVVYEGHPNFNMEQKDGKVFVINKDFNEDSVKLVKDIGYYENGEVILKNNSKGFSTYPFLTKMKDNKKYIGKKIPVVGLEINGKKILYPVGLKSTTVDASTEVTKILNSDIATQDKILDINKVLIENNISLNDFGLTNSNFNEENVLKVMNILKEVTSYPDVGQWMNNGEMSSVLLNDTHINIDLLDTPFHSPKIRTDIQNTIGLIEGNDEAIVSEEISKEVEEELEENQNKNC